MWFWPRDTLLRCDTRRTRAPSFCTLAPAEGRHGNAGPQDGGQLPGGLPDQFAAIDGDAEQFEVGFAIPDLFLWSRVSAVVRAPSDAKVLLRRCMGEPEVFQSAAE